jgi:hypothetical protein
MSCQICRSRIDSAAVEVCKADTGNWVVARAIERSDNELGGTRSAQVNSSSRSDDRLLHSEWVAVFGIRPNRRLGER